MFVHIAWRNLWRNRRRTILTTSAVAGSIVMMLFMSGLMRGMNDRMLEGLVSTSGGHVQIHREGYRTEHLFTLTVPDAQRVLEKVRSDEHVAAAAGRIYGFAQASFVRGQDAEIREGGGEDVGAPMVALFGVEPEQELRVTDMSKRVREGRWLRSETDVVIGATLAKRHGIRLGDAMLPTTVAATGAMQGPWAVSDEVPRVVGFIRTGVDEIDSSMVVMHLGYLSRLVRLEDQVHEVAIRANDPERLEEVVASLRRRVAEARATAVPHEGISATTPLAVGLEQASGAPPGPDAPRARLVGVRAHEVGAEHEVAAITKGRFIQRAEDALLPAALAARLGVDVGGRVTVAVPVECAPDPFAEMMERTADAGAANDDGGAGGGDAGAPPERCPPSAESFRLVGILADDALPPGIGPALLISDNVVRENVIAMAPALETRLEGDAAAALAASVRLLRGEGTVRDEILDWRELNPSVAQMIEMMEVMPIIFYVIIYFAVVLGILNTMLMATFERIREFGIMRAIGLRAPSVVRMVVTESALLALVGIALGLALGLPIVWAFGEYGLDMSVWMEEGQNFDIEGIVFDTILYLRITTADVVELVVAIFVMTSVAGVWPALKAARIQPTEAIRHE